MCLVLLKNISCMVFAFAFLNCSESNLKNGTQSRNSGPKVVLTTVLPKASSTPVPRNNSSHSNKNNSTQSVLKLSEPHTKTFQKNFLNHNKLVDNEENFVYSPVSAYVSLADLYNGAGDNTAAELRLVLGLEDNKDQLLDGTKLLESFKSADNNVSIQLLSRIWTAENLGVNNKFKTDSKTYFGDPIDQIDTSDSTKSAKKVNSWASEETKKKIKNIISPDDVTTDSKLIVTNAVYFHGKWAKPFDESLAKDETFNTLDNKKIPVATIYAEGSFAKGTVNGLALPFVELPYEGNKFKMIVVKSSDAKSLQELKKNFGDKGLGIFGRTRNTILAVTLPKFSIETSFDAKTVLEPMGLKNAFTKKANFSKVSEKNVKLDKFVQTAVIEADEGVDANAASKLSSYAVRESNVNGNLFTIDKPFFFVIVDDKENVLLAGQVTDPSKLQHGLDYYNYNVRQV